MKYIYRVLLVSITVLLLSSAEASAQNTIVVQGTVTSAKDGETLLGVNVVEVDSKQRIVNATITDLNGKYVLKVSDRNNPLLFSYIGFKNKNVEIDNRTVIDIQLEEEALGLEEVVVTAARQHSDGTFAVPEREVSTAVQTISMKAVEGVSVTSIDDALQGRIAGLDIVNNSGDLGSGASMKVRGTTSINSNTQPLIVVNDIPYEIQIDPSFDFATANQEQYANMLSINPDDIEEITVLKDAASMAVWGSKGANGVLMIKTKKGATGKTQVQYTYRLSRAVQPQGMNMLNGDDYTMMMKQAFFNPRQNDDAADVEEFNYNPNFYNYENFNENTNWFDEVTQVGWKNDHYLTVSGGGGRARFRVSGGFLDQTGTVIGQEMSRISSRAYLDYWVSDRIQFITEFAFTYTDNDRNYSDDAHKESILGIAYRKMPNVSVFEQNLEGVESDTYFNIPRTSTLNASQRDMMNPVALALLATNNLKNFRIQPTFRLQYYLLDPEEHSLKYKMYVSFDVNNNKTSKFLPMEVSNISWNDPSANYAEEQDTEDMTVLMENSITWQPRFSNTNHSAILFASNKIRTGSYSIQKQITTNLPSYAISDPSVEGYIQDMWTNYSNYRSMSMLFRGHYSYKSRYILTATFRRDGSTKFGKENKFGNFPGISVKWIISDEPWMDWSNGWLSMFALRPSWGVGGREPKWEYLHYSRYQPYGSYAGESATRPTSITLANLKWETNTSMNYGMDLGFLNDRFVLDLNFYQNRTEDLLFENLAVSSSSGYSAISYKNGGTMDNDGWEMNFNTYKAIALGKFQVDFNFNLSNYVNTIIYLDQEVLDQYNNDFNFRNGSYLSRIQEGNSYGSIYGFKYLGVYQYSDYIPGVQENAPVARDANGDVIYDQKGNPLPMYFAYGTSSAYEFQGGDAKYEDINHDGSIDELDIVYLGNSNPKVNGGFGTSIRWGKNLMITAFFNFRYGNKIVNAARMNAENMYSLNNQSVSVNWRWRKDGDSTDMPRALYDYGYNWLGSDRYVEDGSFLRFKYLTLNYTIPDNKIKNWGISQARLYLTINNLATLSYYTGVDPEIAYDSFNVSTDNSSTPRSKDITVGISVTF